MKANVRKILFVLKIALGILYFFLAGEVFLRVLAPEPILPRYVCATSYGIRGNEPNRNYWHTTTEYHINIRTNSKGIRADKEIPYQKPDGVKRIVLLGDSFGIGYGVNLEDTFSMQMKNYLEETGIKCEVVNLSVSGHGTSEQLITLEEQGFLYQPDLVLLAWHGSDLADNVRANLYQLKDGILVQKNKVYLPGVKIREFLFQFSAYRLLAGHSHMYSCMRENAAHLIKYTVLPAIRSLSGDGSEQEPSPDAVERAALYRKDLAVALLEQIKQECVSHNANFLILDIPNNLSRTEFTPTFPDVDKAIKEFDVFCPIELFKKHKGDKLYWEKSHGHFTPLGCRIIGEGLAKVILEQNLLNGNN
jgi:lysophospholipase L1-like esterase